MNSAIERASFECALELLKSNQDVCLVAHGGSMRPFIRSGDRLRVLPSGQPRQVGEIVWAHRDGVDVIHRIICVKPGGRFELRGDAMPSSDGWFEDECYLGSIQSVERSGSVRLTPQTTAHRCFVAFIRGLRHIEWKLATVFNHGG